MRPATSIGRMSRIGVLVQARMSSRRLPAKVLTPLDGEPMLGLVLERLGHAELPAAVIVTTSLEADDDAVEEFCDDRGVVVFRGPLDDVAARLVGAAESHVLDAVVRVSGDSPFIDQALVDRAIELHAGTGAAVVSNVHPVRTFPPGQSVELLDIDALRRATELMTQPGDREHVTPAVYRNADEFQIASFAAPEPRPDVRLTVDEPDHVELAESILRRMDRPRWEYGWQEVAALAQTSRV